MLMILGSVFVIAVLYALVKRLADSRRKESDDEPDKW